MNATNKAIEVRAFGVKRNGVELPRRYRRKPTAEQTIEELQAELDAAERGEVQDGELELRAADVEDGQGEPDGQPGDVATVAAVAMQPTSDDEDDEEQLRALGLTTWSRG